MLDTRLPSPRCGATFLHMLLVFMSEHVECGMSMSATESSAALEIQPSQPEAHSPQHVWVLEYVCGPVYS